MTDAAPRDYGRSGWIGIGTPQANPTVEAEMAIALPRRCAIITARLRSTARQAEQRLRDYLLTLDDTLAGYDRFTPDIFGFACTGSSYLLGAEREQALVARIAASVGYPILTATTAIHRSLTELGARRIALLAPYPEPLIAAAQAYWRALGYTIVETRRIETRSDDTRSIYGLRAADAAADLAAVDLSRVDAVLLSGTGLATLPLIGGWHHAVPLLSSNLCLAAQLLADCGGGDQIDRATLRIAGLDTRLREAGIAPC